MFAYLHLQSPLAVRAVLYALLCLLILPFSAQASNDARRERTLVLGAISTNPQKHVRLLRPLADYLAADLAEQGITRAEIAVAKDKGQMVRWLKQGRVDMLSETVFTAHELAERTGAELLVRRWKKGASDYHTVFFTRKDSSIHSFADLQGKTIAFEDRGSTSSFFIPASLLLSQGYELYELSSPREKPPADKIGFLFAESITKSGNEVNLSVWVHNRIIAASAFSSANWLDDEDNPKQLRDNMRVFYQSEAFPRSLQLVRSDLPEPLKARLRHLLLTAHESETGMAALKHYQKTSKFDALTPEIMQGVDLAGELRVIVNEQLIY